MEKIIVKSGEPIRIVIQPKKIEIVEHKIVSEDSPTAEIVNVTEESQA